MQYVCVRARVCVCVCGGGRREATASHPIGRRGSGGAGRGRPRNMPAAPPSHDGDGTAARPKRKSLARRRAFFPRRPSRPYGFFFFFSRAARNNKRYCCTSCSYLRRYRRERGVRGLFIICHGKTVELFFFLFTPCNIVVRRGLPTPCAVPSGPPAKRNTDNHQ